MARGEEAPPRPAQAAALRTRGRRRGLQEKHSRVGVALSLQRPTALDRAQQGAGITLQATGAGSPAQL